MSQDTFSWQAHEFTYTEKSSDWFWAVGIIVVTSSILSLFFGNTLFAIVIILIGVSIGLHANKEPRIIDYELTNLGFLIDNVSYPLASIRAFWIENNSHLGHIPKLILRTRRGTHPIIVIPIENHDFEIGELRDFLLNYVVEQELLEPLSHKIFDYLGF